MGGYYKIGKPSREEYKRWVSIGYLGTYEKYCEDTTHAAGQLVHVSGSIELDHCKHRNCLCLAENLCDYPVGNEKTCDRMMCPEHSHEVGEDMHYCSTHYKQYIEYQKVASLPKLER